MMDDNRWTNLPGVFNEANINGVSRVSRSLNAGESMTSSSHENILRLNDLYIDDDDDKCEVSDGHGKKKKTSRIIGWGLRRFSMIVCKKVHDKGITSYNEVADEIIAELASLEKNDTSPLSQFDEKNIRRRVYDAFNVLLAIDVIAKDKKEIHWVGFPATKTEELKKLQEVHMKLMSSIQRKASMLKELEDQLVDLQKLMKRNQQQCKSEDISSKGIALPFLLVQTDPKATVEIEISEDTQLVHFDFNGSPFALHDDAAILKMMRCPQGAEFSHASQSSSEESTVVTDSSGRPLKWPSFSWNSKNPSL